MDGRTPIVLKRFSLGEELVDETAQAVHVNLFSGGGSRVFFRRPVLVGGLMGKGQDE